MCQYPRPCTHTHTHNHFTALFLGPSGWAGARRELLDFMVQRKINRGRHTDHPAGRHSIRTNQRPPPSPPIYLQAGCPSSRPTNSVKALKATSTFGLGRRFSSETVGRTKPQRTSWLRISLKIAIILRSTEVEMRGQWVPSSHSLPEQSVGNTELVSHIDTASPTQKPTRQEGSPWRHGGSGTSTSRTRTTSTTYIPLTLQTIRRRL